MVSALLEMEDKEIQKVQYNLQKYKIRFPLFFLPWVAGLLSGICCCMLKILSEMVISEGFKASLAHPLFYICLVLVLGSALWQITALN